jgi:gamma-glutamyl-gamma-aminobutyrate hydrolase PuuD
VSHPASRERGGKPIVGITCYEEEAAWGSWDTVAALLPVAYVRSIEAAGAIALLIPPQALTAEDAEHLVNRLDGLVLAGGNDISPVQYGAEPHPETVVAGGERDALELAALTAAAEGAIPTLAVCRGLQVLNVARGGTLIQHLPDVVGHEGHSPTPGSFGEHDVIVDAGSKLAGLLSWSRSAVPTHHHQAIDELGTGLTPSARAEDGTIEAVEDLTVPFLVGVQWHPEAGTDPALFDGLVTAARQRMLTGSA